MERSWNAWSREDILEDAQLLKEAHAVGSKLVTEGDSPKDVDGPGEIKEQGSSDDPDASSVTIASSSRRTLGELAAALAGRVSEISEVPGAHDNLSDKIEVIEPRPDRNPAIPTSTDPNG